VSGPHAILASKERTVRDTRCDSQGRVLGASAWVYVHACLRVPVCVCVCVCVCLCVCVSVCAKMCVGVIWHAISKGLCLCA
jgi:hypothetical protein